MATQPTGAPLNANKISIVTKSEIRYEGILYHINPQDQNITLCNVKSFGTEGRRPGDEIAPSPQVHEYIIFRGSDIKDLKVLEAAPQTDAQAQAGDAPKEQQQQATNVQAPNEEKKESAPRDFKMNQGSNQEDFDFQGMQQKFQQVALEHKQSDIHAYEHDDFFDSLSTSTAEKTRELPFDRIAQKKTDKETFGSEYVDNATQRSRGFRRGGGRGRGGYNNRGGGQNRGYGGQNRNYEGGQNRGYGGQNRNYEGGENRGYQGENRGYGGGENRGYGGQNRGYGGGQNRGYGGGQHRNYEGGQNRNYEGGQNGGYGGGQNRGYGGGQNRRYGGGEQQGGGYKNYQNEQTFGQGDMNKDEGRRYGNN